MKYLPDKLLYLPLVLVILTSACKQNEGRKHPDRNEFNTQKELVDRANRYLVGQDKELINSYATRRGWHLQTTESGLFYEIYEHGTGTSARSGGYALITYELSLLDGTPCYISKVSGPKKIMIGQSTDETGLIQGLLMLREGDKARFILPPHLAHGLLGDENKIPPRSIIVYELELLEVTDR